MKAWKIKSSYEWSTDCVICFARTQEEALKMQGNNEIKEWGAIQVDEYPLEIEEWDVNYGDIIKPIGYDSTDASLY